MILIFVLLALAGADSSTYSGHGTGSISPELLKKFAPSPLAPDVSSRVQLMLDIRATGLGMLHPSGKQLFFGWRVTGVPQVWRLDEPKGFPVQVTGGEDPTHLVEITPDGRYLVLSRDRKGEENPGIYLQATQGGELQVVQHIPKVQSSASMVSPDSNWLYFRSNDQKPDSYAIYRYHIKTQKKETVFQEPGIWFLADYRNEDDLLLGKATGSLSREYFHYKPSLKKLTPVIGQGEKEDYEVQFGVKANQYLVLTPKLGDFKALYRLEKGELIPFGPQKPVELSGFSIDSARNRIYLTWNNEGYSQLEVLDAQSGKVIGLKLPKGAEQTYSGWTSRDGRYVTIGVESGKSPRTGYVLDWKNSKWTQWTVPSIPETDLTRFVSVSLEKYPARDGTLIPMFVRRPVDCVRGKKVCPVVVHFHGGPEAQSTPGFSTYAQLFVDRGMIFAEPNVRGSDGYGKAWLNSDNGPKRLEVISDIEDAARYFRLKEKLGDKEPKVGIMGGSYGGYATLMGMTYFAGAYDCGVASVGMSDLRTFLMNTAPYRRTLRISEYGDPEKDSEALKKLSPIEYLDRVKGPLLIIQGVNDPRVPAGEAVQMWTSMDKKGLQPGLILFGDQGHGSVNRMNQVLEIGHTLQFMEKYLSDPKTN